MVDLTGRIALITGASRGIGRAVAIALAQAGVDVAINYRLGEQEARATMERIAQCGRRAITVQADVSSNAEVARMVETVEKELSGIDIMVNNAGIANPKGIEDITEADWDETITVNLKSAFLVIQAVLPGMRERGWGRSLTSPRAQLTPVGSSAPTTPHPKQVWRGLPEPTLPVWPARGLRLTRWPHPSSTRICFGVVQAWPSSSLWAGWARRKR